MSQHTPGPWRIGNNGWTVWVAPKRLISVEGRTADEALANARLIAAAPELLAGLQWAMVWLPKVPLPPYDQELRNIFAENLEHCSRAIAKAEGTS